MMQCQEPLFSFKIFLESKIVVNTIASILVFGTICNILSFAVFCQSRPREWGTGIYRLWISIIGQLGIILLGMDLFRIFNVEYPIFVLVSIYYSLTACVMIEQVVVAYLTLRFSKDRSRQIAKIVIPISITYHSIIALPFLFTNSTQFICFYKNILNIIHLLIPFVINLISPLLVISILVKHYMIRKQYGSFCHHICNVLSMYKVNFIIPCILIVLLIPRVIFTFYFLLTTQSWQNVTYFVVYLLSLVPFTTTLLLFVLPSSERREDLTNILSCTFKYARVITVN